MANLTNLIDSAAVEKKHKSGFIKVISDFVKGVKSLDARQWRKIALAVVLTIAGTIAFAYLSRFLLQSVFLPLNMGGWMTYIIVFGTFLVTNLSLFIPLPLALTVLTTTAMMHNPLLLGLAAALGAGIGELSGYAVGFLGRKILIRENFMCGIHDRFCNSRLSRDVEKHGLLAIGILAAQPVLPFDIAGILAGSLRMNLARFFVAVLAGKAVKYVAIAFSAGLFSFLSF